VYADKGCYFQNSSFTQDCTSLSQMQKAPSLALGPSKVVALGFAISVEPLLSVIASAKKPVFQL
ncbi:hypothetical protein A2U01_0119182, partial [Trifolium medium]|nr:hypothetical protein [Trifolium medium]